jgi:hypothetical protein
MEMERYGRAKRERLDRLAKKSLGKVIAVMSVIALAVFLLLIAYL